MVRKKRSLVLNNEAGHNKAMNTNRKPSNSRRIRAFLRYAWNDQVAAQRALLRPPYDDYLINRRNGH